MPIDFRNTNTVWASVLVETLQRLGLTTAIICPGSRSTPLAIAFASHPDIEAIPVLDERSAAFFALGMAKKLGLPVALVCTSGTAGANFFPAVIEAKESRVPLLILTGDRPPELRDCHSGQTIDQVKLYGHYPNWHAELATPCLSLAMLGYLRQFVIQAWEKSLFPTPGVVHLNLPFRDPLAPIREPQADLLQSQLQAEDFFAGISPYSPVPLAHSPSFIPVKDWQESAQGVIIAGVAQSPFPQDYCQAIASLAQTLKFPVLSEGLSPVRNYNGINPYLISTYDLILRNSEFALNLIPEIVIQIGDLPTSKVLRNWLESHNPRKWIIDPSFQNLDPLHGKTTHLRLTVEQVAQMLELEVEKKGDRYLQNWCQAEIQVRQAVDQKMSEIEELFEGKVAWLLSQILPPKTPLLIANSMPVRDIEFFWKPNHLAIQPFFNRGANGIDGTLSTALGMAHRNQASVMLTGDLALLHDTNGFLFNQKFSGHLTIILINNNGGGIFEMLPISQFEPPFEEFFATPQNVNFAQLCATYQVEYVKINNWAELKSLLNPLPQTGIRVLEIPTHRKRDAQWRKTHLNQFSEMKL